MEYSPSHLSDERLARLAVLEERADGGEERDRDHETRIRILERFIWKAAGAFGVFAVLGSILGGAIAHALFQ